VIGAAGTAGAMGGQDTAERPRPYDPAGTRPKVDPQTLKPQAQAPLLLAPQGEGQPLAQMTSTAHASPPHQADHLDASQAPRFQFLFGAMAAFGAAAVALAVLILSAPTPKPGPAWSIWSPQTGSIDVAQQIANHVAPEYKLSNGHQLLKVTGGPQSINGQPVVLAMRTSGSTPAALPDNGVFYQLCGGGPSCSISQGRASVQRGLLVRREALELALYTFRYIGGASQVLVTFPPPPPSAKRAATHSATQSSTAAKSLGSTNEAPSHVLLFRPAELQTELSRPLAQSLSAVTPSVSTMNKSSDAALVSRLTERAVYDSVLIQQQQSSPVLLLQPPSVGG
jgi:hypothetical protein